MVDVAEWRRGGRGGRSGGHRQPLIGGRSGGAGRGDNAASDSLFVTGGRAAVHTPSPPKTPSLLSNTRVVRYSPSQMWQ